MGVSVGVAEVEAAVEALQADEGEGVESERLEEMLGLK